MRKTTQDTRFNPGRGTLRSAARGVGWICAVGLAAFLCTTVHAQPPRVELPIPDRSHAPEAPKEGWCGESAIQQILLYYGAWYPQSEINRLGKPQHPDLYASDLPVALRAVGLQVKRAPRTRDAEVFFAWVRHQLDAGRPVLAGVKIHPTAHPNWSLDHFVVIVGYDGTRFLLNTTWGEQRWRSTEQLTSFAKGLSFANKHRSFYALAVTRASGDGAPAALRVVEEADELKINIVCDGLRKGSDYELVTPGSKSVPVPFRAKGAQHIHRTAVTRGRSIWFECRAVGER
jgi:hypothetical protein